MIQDNIPLNMYGKFTADLLTRCFVHAGRHNFKSASSFCGGITTATDGRVLYLFHGWRKKKITNRMISIIVFDTAKYMFGVNDLLNCNEDRVIVFPKYDYINAFMCYDTLPKFHSTLMQLKALYMLLLGKSFSQVQASCGEAAAAKVMGVPSDPFLSMQRQALLSQMSNVIRSSKLLTPYQYSILSASAEMIMNGVSLHCTVESLRDSLGVSQEESDRLIELKKQYDETFASN